MLQQTQAERVVPYYEKFLKKFPTVEKLAKAKTSDVLKLWQGLGYNRRALHLKRAAEVISEKHNGKFPKDYDTLLTLPGVGPATAGDILAFAWNIPAVVLETNIRQVFFHHFFPASLKLRRTGPCRIHDKEVYPLVEKTLDKKNPREWYYALMDYGAYLKKSGNTISRSAHYTKQSKFKGSNRELRSQILKLILKKPRTEAEVLKLLSSPAPTIKKNILALHKEGLININRRKLTPAE